jgi:seryl-tRNA synthetase
MKRAVGTDDSANVEIRRTGEPTQFPFEPRPLWENRRGARLFWTGGARKGHGARFIFTGPGREA